MKSSIPLILCLSLCSGCRLQNRSVALPATPPLPYIYTQADYAADFAVYNANATQTDPAKQALAQQARNSIEWGLMGAADAMYSAYSANLFVGKGVYGVAGDTTQLAATAGAAIAVRNATKTLFGVLGTALAGVNLSVASNFFNQQLYPSLSIAMDNRRAAVEATIEAGMQKPVSVYPLSAAKRDVVLYLYAGSLPGALQEIQREAGAQSVQAKAMLQQIAK
jgi:hypothetical protein